MHDHSPRNIARQCSRGNADARNRPGMPAPPRQSRRKHPRPGKLASFGAPGPRLLPGGACQLASFSRRADPSFFREAFAWKALTSHPGLRKLALFGAPGPRLRRTTRPNWVRLAPRASHGPLCVRNAPFSAAEPLWTQGWRCNVFLLMRLRSFSDLRVSAPWPRGRKIGSFGVGWFRRSSRSAWEVPGVGKLGLFGTGCFRRSSSSAWEVPGVGELGSFGVGCFRRDFVTAMRVVAPRRGAGGVEYEA